MTSILIRAAVEGLLDEVVVARLLDATGASLGPVFGKAGKEKIQAGINGYNNSARFLPWVVLVDLNGTACAPTLVATWLPHCAPFMCFRVAVREIEAWLLADRERISRFLGLRMSNVPLHPETLPDPKRTLVELAAHSRHRDIRLDLVPRPGSGRPTGPAYDSRLGEFVLNHWRPSVARRHSPSLDGSIRALEAMMRRVKKGGTGAEGQGEQLNLPGAESSSS